MAALLTLNKKIPAGLSKTLAYHQSYRGQKDIGSKLSYKAYNTQNFNQVKLEPRRQNQAQSQDQIYMTDVRNLPKVDKKS